MEEVTGVEGKVGEIKINDTTTIVVSVSDWRDVTRLDIRKYVDTKAYKGFTKQGISIPMEMVEELCGIISTVVQNIKGLDTSE